MRRERIPRTTLACLAVACLVGAAPPAAACKYTVRDVAFVTLREAPFQLHVALEQSASDELVAQAQAAAELALTDANVTVQCHAGEFLELESAADSPSLDISERPAIVLAAADGRQLRVPWPDDGAGDLVDTLRATCRELTASPAQQELRQLLLAGHHSVIVLQEGIGDPYNQQARETIAGLIAEVERALPSLPKPIELPPKMLVVSQQQTSREKVFLWSLGIDPEQFEQAHVTIVFGRCRLLGPPMPVPGTTRGQMLRRLAAVGQDCECELDRSVMRGQMVLHEWTAREEEQAANMLGFDPGNPLVQVEIQRILSRGPIGDRPPAESIDLAVDDLSLGGLQIIDIGTFGETEEDLQNQSTAESTDAPSVETKTDVAATPAAMPQSSASEPIATAPSPPSPPIDPTLPPQSSPRGPMQSAMLWLIGIVAAVGVAGAAWIIARGG